MDKWQLTLSFNVWMTTFDMAVVRDNRMCWGLLQTGEHMSQSAQTNYCQVAKQIHCYQFLHIFNKAKNLGIISEIVGILNISNQFVKFLKILCDPNTL